VIFYWRDALETAGVDEISAFSTPQQMEETFKRLQASGYNTPWGVPTSPTADTVHHIASWVWGADGDFVAASGLRTAFSSPESLAGIGDYFRLHRYVPTHEGHISDEAVEGLFRQRKVFAMLNGLWAIGNLREQGLSDDLLSKVGVALPPGPPFVGSSNLVIWGHTAARDEKAAVDLVALLTGVEAQVALSHHAHMMPVRVDVLNQPPYTDDPYMQVFVEALHHGRSLPNISLWGVVEDKLVEIFGQIWEDILANPSLRVEDIVAQHLEPLAARLDKTLAQT